MSWWSRKLQVRNRQCPQFPPRGQFLLTNSRKLRPSIKYYGHILSCSRSLIKKEMFSIFLLADIGCCQTWNYDMNWILVIKEDNHISRGTITSRIPHPPSKMLCALNVKGLYCFESTEIFIQIKKQWGLKQSLLEVIVKIYHRTINMFSEMEYSW